MTKIETPIYTKEKPATIQTLFDSIAKKYDTGNAILSFQMHRFWNATLIRTILSNHPPQTYLDLCCGTGDIALGYLKGNNSTTKTIMLDFSHEMLEVAKEKANKLNLTNIEYLQADAQVIPLPDCSVDAVTIAYGIRNIKDPARCVREVYRVLKPGGRFGILELTRPRNRFLKWGHHIYLTTMLPRIAKWITSNEEAYRYLCNSIHHFMTADEMEGLLVDAGFEETGNKRLFGGIATIVKGRKK